MTERDVLTVDFFLQKIPFPTFTSADYLKQTADDMLHLVQTPRTTSTTQTLAFGSPILNSYEKIAELLRRAVPPPAPVAPTNSPSPVLAQRVLPHPTPASTASVAPQRVPAPSLSIQKSQPAKHPFSASSPLAKCREISPRFSHRPAPRQQLAQSLQHDPTVAGKMYNPVTGRAENIDSLLRGPDTITWTTSLTNEWARCAQGIVGNRPSARHIVGNQTIFFIFPSQVPAGRKVTYATFVCTMRPGKAEPYQIRMTVGGDRLDAYQDVRSPAVGVTDTKLHINSTISDAKDGVRCCTGDLKDFFLVSQMKKIQCMRVHRRCTPQEIMDACGLTEAHFDSKGCAYLEIREGMCGLKEASVLAYDQLKEHLAPYGHAPVRFTPGLWKHNNRRTTFTLAVDDFGIKYFHKADADHLFSALHDKYELTKDWTGTSYLGLTLNWNHKAGCVDILMPNYVPKALAKFQHASPKSAQHAPHLGAKPIYGQKVQHANTDTSALLNKADTQRVQSVSGAFLCCAGAVDPTMLPALNKMSNKQAKPTMLTGKACDLLLHYLATHPDATIRHHHASDMILCMVADAAYLVLPNAHSRCAGLFFLSNNTATDPPATSSNGAVHVLCKTIRGVPASAAEAETGGLFLNGQEAIPIITALEEMGHQQPPTGTSLETDNSTAHDILKAQARMKRSKAFDMRCHWLKDRIARSQFNLCWAPGKHNRANYFTKHHPPSHHQIMRPNYLQRLVANVLTTHMRGCVTPPEHVHM
jgi:hypothetical protein